MTGNVTTHTQTSFENLNFGTVVTTSSYQLVEVEIDPAFTMQDYGEAIARDLRRRNPIRYAAVDEEISNDDLPFDSFAQAMQMYVVDLAKIRIQSINGDCKVWREAKQLAIPPYIQFALSQIGTVYDIDHGRKYVPCMTSPELGLSMKQLIMVTDYLRVFLDDGVSLLFDAFPRGREGDQEAMSYAIIDGYVKGQQKTSNPAKSYVAAFLGMKVRQENEFRCLYSVRYDDAEFVKDRLIEELTR